MSNRAVFPLPVLMYHDVVETTAWVKASHLPYVVTVEQFRGQMDALARLKVSGISLKDLLQAAPDEIASRGSTCVLTFDDGHESNFTRALPILREFGFQATFFITTGWVGKESYLTWPQVRSLAASGMEIGSHSVTHRPPASLAPEELLSEMRDSRTALEDQLGNLVLTASAPTGFFNSRLASAAEEAGYSALCYGRIGLWEDPARKYGIPRVPIKHKTTLKRMERIATRDSRLIRSLRNAQLMRDALKSLLGPGAYTRIRRILMDRGTGRQ